METVRKIFLDPEGWKYFHLLGTGAFFKKTIHKTSEESTVFIHHIPTGVTNLTSRPTFVFTGTHEKTQSDYIEKNITSIPFDLSLDLGELDIDVMGQEYINFLMSLHDARRSAFKTFAESIQDHKRRKSIVTTWVLADTHFRDNNCLKFRQFDTLGEMEAAILGNCRRLIKKEDTLYLLGDMAASKEGLSLARDIRGRKKIVWGNHDLLPLSLYNLYFPQAEFRMWYKIGAVILSHVPLHTQELEYEGTFPHSLPPRYNIHGHVHNFSVQDDRYFNASVDVNAWGPVRLDDILSRWNLPH